MVEVAQSQLVTNVAHDLIAQIAPQELPLFSVTSEAYFKNPEKLLKGQKGKDETLGFGIEIASAVMMSPIVLTIVDEVIKVIVGEVIPGEIKKSGIISKISKKLRPDKEKDKKVTLPLPLTLEQLKQVHDLTLSEAGRFNLPKPQAELLADSLVGSLTLANK